MYLKPPREHDSEPLQARFYEAASASCLLASLALLLHADEASDLVSRVAGVGSLMANAVLGVVAASWVLATILGARRSLVLRHGASHFERQHDFEAEVEWTEQFLGLRERD